MYQSLLVSKSIHIKSICQFVLRSIHIKYIYVKVYFHGLSRNWGDVRRNRKGCGPGCSPIDNCPVKLPSFWTNSPEVWFIQAEAQFENKRIISSHTKFTHCVAALPQDVVCRLLDLVPAPPAESYRALRRRLIQMYSLSVFKGVHFPGLAEFAFVVRPMPLWADGQDLGPPPWRQ